MNQEEIERALNAVREGQAIAKEAIGRWHDYLERASLGDAS